MLKTAAKWVWRVYNLAPTTANKVVLAAGAPQWLARAIYLGCTFGDWFTPGPVLSGSVLVVGSVVLAARYIYNRLAK